MIVLIRLIEKVGRQKDKCENAPVESLASERLLSALCAHAKKMRGDKKMKIQQYVNWIPPLVL